MSIDFLYSHVGHLVRRLQQISVAVFGEETEAHGITPVQFGALTAIAEHPQLDIQRLANLAAVDRATLGGVIERLDKLGLVVRCQDERDKRSRVVKVLPTGQQLLENMAPDVKAADHRLLLPLSDLEQQVFMIYLRQLVHTGNDFSRAPLVTDESGGRSLSLYAKPGYLVRRLQQICEGIFANQMSDFGLTPGQYAALAAVSETKGSDNTWVANATGLDRVTIGSIIQRLDARGLIGVRSNVLDKRAKSLHITNVGKKMLRLAEPRIQEADDRITESFSEPDRDEFVRLLRNVVDANNEASRAPLRRSTRKPAARATSKAA